MAKAQTRKTSPKARREAVEAAIREHGWDHQLALVVAKKTGWSWRTIYRDRDAIVARLAVEEEAGLEHRRAAFLTDVRAVAAKAKRADKFGPAAKLMQMECAVLGLDRPAPAAEVEADAGPLDTSLEGVLKETRRMRRRAQAEGSFVAADRLLERELEIVKEIRQRDEAEAQRRRGHLGEDELVAMIEAVAARLPDQVRRRLLGVLGGVDGE